jgi:hypothetical protein
MQDWIGPLSLLVTLTGVVTTLIAAISAAWIGKQYVSHIQEIASVRQRYDDIIKELTESNKRDEARLLLATKGVESLFGLVVAMRRQETLAAQRELVLRDKKWGGSELSPEEVGKTVSRIDVEIRGTSLEIRAREHELYLLVTGGNNSGAHLRDIVETWGDRQSLSVLEAISDCPAGSWDKEAIVTAIYELRRRLRSTPRS